MSDLELYYFPGSYFSQRVSMALEEKGLNYKHHLINLMDLENHSAWFMKKVNAEGQVPVLRDGEKFIADSPVIIRHLDQHHPPASLRPEKHRSEIRGICDMIDEIKMDTQSYGGMVFQETARDAKMPQYFRNMMKAKAEAMTFVKILKDQYKKHPELSELYERKIKANVKMNGSMLDKEAVVVELNRTKSILADLNQRLINNGYLEVGGEEQWLVGDTFTMADIHLSILLARVVLSGHGHWMWADGSEMPAMMKYLDKVRQRRSYRKWAIEGVSLPFALMMAKMRIQSKLPKAALFITLGALTAYAAYTYLGKK